MQPKFLEGKKEVHPIVPIVPGKAGGEREWNFPALGDGYIDFPSIFDFLKEEGDCSPFSVEIEFTPDGAGSLEEVNKAVRKSYDYLHKHKIV